MLLCLRKKEIIVQDDISRDETNAKQLCLIRLMLNHEPNERPTAKELLLNEMIPRKADEIALDEMLQYSFSNKQSTNYKKILKALFEQKTSKPEDASFDSTNCKSPTSFRHLQIREHVYNTLIRLFQRNGGYMIHYPLLTPYNEFFNDYNKCFKLTDSSGLVVSLPYNHRVSFFLCLIYFLNFKVVLGQKNRNFVGFELFLEKFVLYFGLKPLKHQILKRSNHNTLALS